MSQNTYDIPALASGDGLTELNDRFQRVEGYFDELDGMLNSKFSKSSMLLYNQPLLDATVGYGSLVYYDTENACFASAKAVLAAVPGDNGESIEAPEARVMGLVIDHPSGTPLTGTILIGGYYQSADIAAACFEGGFTSPGLYYLSPNTAGKAIHESQFPDGHLRQPVLMYFGDGAISMSIFYQAQDGHYHSSASLTGNWEAADSLASDTVEPPADALWGYEILNQDYVALGKIAEGITAVFYNGMLDTKGGSGILVSGIRYAKYPTENTIALYAWKTSTADVSPVLYTEAPVPEVTDVAYTDRPTTSHNEYTVTAASAASITVTINQVSVVYVRHAESDLPAYAWIAGTEKRYTESAFPVEGDMAYTDVNCTVGGLAVATAWGNMFVIKDGILWCKTATPPASGTVTLFNHYPFAYNASVVRTVTSSSDRLSVSLINGNCELGMDDWRRNAAVPSIRAVSDINDNWISYTPVVPAVAAGPGIDVTSLSDGTAVISANGMLGSIQDAYALMHNGTTVSSDGTYQYVVFPRGRESEVIMTLPIAPNSANADMTVTVWGMPVGAGASLEISAWFVPDPSSNVASTMPVDGTDLGVLQFPDTGGKAAFVETSNSLTVSGGGLLMARLVRGNTSGSDDFRLLRLGFRLRVIAQSTVAGVTPSGGTAGMYGKSIAGASISAGTLVKMDTQGRLMPCSNTSVDDADTCLGVTVDGALEGGEISYMYVGVYDATGVGGLYAGCPVYVGQGGAIASTRPLGAAFIQRVGTALSASQIQIALGTAIIQ